jgi:sporulation protein YlmC with PRC-barrel domain
MSDKAGSTVVLFGLVCLLSGTALAAEPAAQPQMYNGYTNRAPRTPTVSETADEITAKQAIGGDVQDATGAVVAKIADLIADRKDNAVEAAILESAGEASFSHGRATVAWTSLKFEGKPTPHFVTELSHEALASGTSFKTAAEARNAYYDVKSDLLGKTAVGKDGSDLGHIKDLVFTFGNGKLVALVIDTGGLISVGAKEHAVAWDKANPEAGKGGASVRLALTKQEVEAAPSRPQWRRAP